MYRALANLKGPRGRPHGRLVIYNIIRHGQNPILYVRIHALTPPNMLCKDYAGGRRRMRRAGRGMQSLRGWPGVPQRGSNFHERRGLLCLRVCAKHAAMMPLYYQDAYYMLR